MRTIIILIIAVFIGGCESLPEKDKPINEISEPENIINNIENGIYLLKDMGVSANDLTPSGSEIIIQTNELFEHNASDSIKFYLVDLKEFVPMKITKKPIISANPNPKIKEDTTRLSQLKITLSPEYASLLEKFTTKHVDKKITIVIGGMAITKHKIRVPIIGGNLQISRCTDEACSVLLSEMENNVLE